MVGIFCHQNQAAPPSLSVGVKADLLHCLKSDQPETTSTPGVDATILDGEASCIVKMLNPCTLHLIQLEKVHRLNLVWDVYLPDSLKGPTRQKRGKGIRKRVAPSTVIHKNWKDFLRVDEKR